MLFLLQLKLDQIFFHCSGTLKAYWYTIEILDLECVLCHVTGVQNENKNALINPPSWIFPRSVVYKMSWGEFNLPL